MNRILRQRKPPTIVVNVYWYAVKTVGLTKDDGDEEGDDEDEDDDDADDGCSSQGKRLPCGHFAEQNDNDSTEQQ